MADAARINGNLYSWSSIVFKIGGERWSGLTSINYGDALERVKGYGMGRSHTPRGRSAGKYTTEPVTASGWKDAIQLLRETLAAQASDGVSYGTVEFDVVIQYVESGSDPVVDELLRCVWSKNSAKAEESADPLKEDVEFDVLYIKRNGATLYDARDGGAP